MWWSTIFFFVVWVRVKWNSQGRLHEETQEGLNSREIIQWDPSCMGCTGLGSHSRPLLGFICSEFLISCLSSVPTVWVLSPSFSYWSPMEAWSHASQSMVTKKQPKKKKKPESEIGEAPRWPSHQVLPFLLDKYRLALPGQPMFPFTEKEHHKRRPVSLYLLRSTENFL